MPAPISLNLAPIIVRIRENNRASMRAHIRDTVREHMRRHGRCSVHMVLRAMMAEPKKG